MFLPEITFQLNILNMLTLFRAASFVFLFLFTSSCTSSSLHLLISHSIAKVMFSLAPAYCHGAWHSVKWWRGRVTFPCVCQAVVGPVYLSACSEEAESHCWEQSLSTEQSQRSAPLNTFDLHISIRFHIRMPAFPQLAPAPLPSQLASQAEEGGTLGNDSEVLLPPKIDAQTHGNIIELWADIIIITCSVLALTITCFLNYASLLLVLLICPCWAPACGFIAPLHMGSSTEVSRSKKNLAQAVGLGTD